jgi:3D (Asp-Asp-Asp) domain-containing protein
MRRNLLFIALVLLVLLELTVAIKKPLTRTINPISEVKESNEVASVVDIVPVEEPTTEITTAEEVTTTEVEETYEYEEVVEEEPSSNYLGYYTLTAYEWTGNPCANGNYPTEGYTVACNSLPLGTRIYIEGYGEYVVEDRGGMSDSVIDIYLGDYDTCIQFGVQGANVYIVE